MADPLLSSDPAILVALKTMSLLLGGTISWVSYRAWRRTGSHALRALTAGFALVTVGSIVAGGLHQLLGLQLRTGVLVESLFTVTGFAVITYAVFLREPAGSDVAAAPAPERPSD